MEKSIGKVREKSGNFVSPKKWELCRSVAMLKVQHKFWPPHSTFMRYITKCCVFFLAVNDFKRWLTTEVGLTSFGNLSARHKKVNATHC